MAAKSKHWCDVYVWLNTVLESCTTKEQVTNARHLFLRFEAMYQYSSIKGVISDLTRDLYLKSIILRDELCQQEVINYIKKHKENDQRSSIGNDGNIS